MDEESFRSEHRDFCLVRFWEKVYEDLFMCLCNGCWPPTLQHIFPSGIMFCPSGHTVCVCVCVISRFSIFLIPELASSFNFAGFPGSFHHDW